MRDDYQEFVSSFAKVEELFTWRQSVYLTGEESEAIEELFRKAVLDLSLNSAALLKLWRYRGEL